MLQIRRQVLSCFVIGALAFAAGALAGQAPSPTPPSLQTPPAVSSPAQTAAPDLSPALEQQPQPVFLGTLSECRNACYSEYQSCRTNYPYSFCQQLYNSCLCNCNDTCYV